MKKFGRSITASGAALAASLAIAPPAQARIVRIEITSETPAFGGKTFGGTGGYVLLKGKAHGELDPELARTGSSRTSLSRRRTRAAASSTRPTSRYCVPLTSPRATTCCSSRCTIAAAS